MTRIDTLEGFVPNRPFDSAYRRYRRTVTTCTGRTAASWVYVGRADQVHDFQPIPGGDWVVYAAGKQRQMADWWKSIDTVFGRLGHAKNKS